MYKLTTLFIFNDQSKGALTCKYQSVNNFSLVIRWGCVPITVADLGFSGGWGRQPRIKCVNRLVVKSFTRNYMKMKEFGPRGCFPSSPPVDQLLHHHHSISSSRQCHCALQNPFVHLPTGNENRVGRSNQLFLPRENFRFIQNEQKCAWIFSIVKIMVTYEFKYLATNKSRCLLCSKITELHKEEWNITPNITIIEIIDSFHVDSHFTQHYSSNFHGTN